MLCIISIRNYVKVNFMWLKASVPEEDTQETGWGADTLESLALMSKHGVIFQDFKRAKVPQPQLLRNESESEKDVLCRKTDS